jgi:hypothetical protein
MVVWQGITGFFTVITSTKKGVTRLFWAIGNIFARTFKKVYYFFKNLYRNISKYDNETAYIQDHVYQATSILISELKKRINYDKISIRFLKDKLSVLIPLAGPNAALER